MSRERRSCSLYGRYGMADWGKQRMAPKPLAIQLVLALAAANAARRNQAPAHLPLTAPNPSSTLTTCSRNNAQAAFTGPPPSSAAAGTPAARKPRSRHPLQPTGRALAGQQHGAGGVIWVAVSKPRSSSGSGVMSCAAVKRKYVFSDQSSSRKTPDNG